MLSTDGHDTTLLSDTRLAFVYLLDDGKGRKSLFWEPEILPQRWYIRLNHFVRAVDIKGLSG